LTKLETREKLQRLEECVRLGEDAYDQMYEPRTHTNPAGHYSDAKDFLGEAISLATALGLNERAKILSARLTHIKAVFLSQF
jgi:hypothetical protein